ncbi:glutathione S-transferase family protein [Pleurocapsa sp. PCC 7319]|uniref:glutathione S-transferase family protein n=1 Tax=Pleurocapsa sp. PCC 7319 TaxID=118161 RepID=UPI00036D5057|nr:glutathione S-transferase family protein [Pleurocapsa sp. PCC 7319]
MIVYGVGTLRTLRVHWTLKELNLSYTTEAIQSRSRQTQTSNYTALHPGQKVPYLQDGNLGISESAAICIYLAERYGDGSLMPAVSKFEQRARVFQACFYAMTELDAHTLYIIAKHGGSLSSYYKQSKEAIEVAIAGFNKQICVADKLISNQNQYILDQEFTVADIILVTCLISAVRLARQFELVIPNKLIKYAKNIQKREAFKLAIVENNR